MLLRTFDEVYQWASAKDPDEIVGIAQTCSSCPLAKCHNELAGTENELDYTFGSTYFYALGEKIDYSRWMKHVIASVDALPKGYEVKARIFVAILKSAKQWEGIS